MAVFAKTKEVSLRRCGGDFFHRYAVYMYCRYAIYI